MSKLTRFISKRNMGITMEKSLYDGQSQVTCLVFGYLHGSSNGEKEGRSNGAVGSPLLRLLEDVFDLGMHDLGS